MVLTRRSGGGTSAEPSTPRKDGAYKSRQVKHPSPEKPNHTEKSNTSKMQSVHYIKTRNSSRLVQDSGNRNVANGEKFLSRPFDTDNSVHERLSRNKYALRHSMSADGEVSMKKKRDEISHSRSLRSLGLEEEGSSCEEDDGIGALAASCRPRSTSRETFPNMLLRRSNRQKKTMYSTLNMSTLEHAVIMNESLEHKPPSSAKKARSIKPELRDLLIAQGKNPDDAESLSQPDIYSSIKSRKRLRRPRRFFDEQTASHPVHIESHHSDHEHEEEKHEDHDENDGEDDEDDDGEDDGMEQDTGRKYSLRTKRAQPLRLVYEIQRQPRAAPRGLFDHLPPSPAHRRRNKLTHNPASPYQTRKRRTNSQGASSTSSSDSDSDERKFQKRKKKSMTKARNRCLPMNLTLNDLAAHGHASDRRKIGSSLADVDPMNIDKTVKFSSIGGHKKHIQSLKEIVVFPLLYREVFEKFGINPPRGCLFYGPPGNGKTLMARALANECSAEGRKVAFFMRKGADCLSKWVGESERQLRLLFDQAYQMRPSIIFFDEIDGLAPVRSSRQDQIHSSIVSTLLGLMDGLDNRGEIIVIGATNRIDAIDPALRRPGRFDREFAFPPPDKKTRQDILRIHTQKWSPPLSDTFLNDLAEKTTGYCGADIMNLCAEATLFALRRRYPQIYGSDEKLKLNVDTIDIQAIDFYRAMKKIVPSAQRSNASPGRALDGVVRPLFINRLKTILQQLASQCPLLKKKSKILKSIHAPLLGSGDRSDDDDSGSEFDEMEARPPVPIPINGLTIPQYLMSDNYARPYRESTIYRPRMLLSGGKADGVETHLAPALLYDLEGIPVHVLDIPALYGLSSHTPEEACAQIFRQARRTAPSIIYMPNVRKWWESAPVTVQHTFEALLKSLPASAPVILIGTADCLEDDDDLRRIFSAEDNEVFTVGACSDAERLAFFAPIFLQHVKQPPVNKHRQNVQRMEVLEKAPPPPVAELTAQELEKIELSEESTMRSLRLFLRDVLTRLAQDRRFKVFLKPVDTEEVPDYTEVIQRPMDISTVMNKIDQHQYCNVAAFVDDINLICSNALEYNPDHCAEDRAIRHRACLMKDIAHAIIEDDLDPEFEKLCNNVIEARKRRKANPQKFAPRYYKVLPKPPPLSQDRSADDNAEPVSTPMAGKQDAATKQVTTSTRKRRRKSTWATGVIKKPKQSKKPKKKESDDVEASTNDDEGQESDKENDSAEDKTQPDENDAGADEGADPDENANSDEKVDEETDRDEQASVDDKTNCDKNANSDEKADEGTDFDEQADESAQETSQSGADTRMVLDVNHSQDIFESTDAKSEAEESSRDSSASLPNSATPNPEAAALANSANDPRPNILSPIEEAIQEVSTAICEHENDTTVEANGSVLVTSTPQDANENDVLRDILEVDIAISNAKEITLVDKIQDEDEPPVTSPPVTRMTLRSRCRSHRGEEHVDDVSIPLPPPPPLIVDEEKLKRLLQYTVEVTVDFHIEDLERLYACLVRSIYNHRHNYDKTLLTQELKEEVNQFIEIRKRRREISLV